MATQSSPSRLAVAGGVLDDDQRHPLHESAAGFGAEA
jgi:hypothetical protein